MPDHNLLLAGLRPEETSPIVLDDLAPRRHARLDRVAKRVFDVSVALVCLVLLAPLFALVALAIWSIDDPAELVYRIGFNPLHQRVRNGR